MHTIQEAQLDGAKYYREQARHAPHNSRTRRGWLLLAEQAEALAASIAREKKDQTKD